MYCVTLASMIYITALFRKTLGFFKKMLHKFTKKVRKVIITVKIFLFFYFNIPSHFIDMKKYLRYSKTSDRLFGNFKWKKVL